MGMSWAHRLDEDQQQVKVEVVLLDEVKGMCGIRKGLSVLSGAKKLGSWVGKMLGVSAAAQRYEGAA